MWAVTSLTTKLALAAVTAGLTGAALYPLYRARTADKLIELRRVELEHIAPPARELDVATPTGISVLDAEHPVFPPSAFVRDAVKEERFGRDKGLLAMDPHVHFRHVSDLAQRRDWDEHPDGYFVLRTNSIGLREDVEVLTEQPDLRLLIAGDSHTDGVCNNDEAFGNLLEAQLGRERPDDVIESLNAGCGGYGFYHYLGTLERFLPQRPDVLVVAVFGGNDFEETLTLFHKYNGTRRPPGAALYGELISDVLARADLLPCLAQAFLSYKYFDVHPGQMEVALQVARDVTTEILVTCLRHSVHPIFVYIPSMPDSEWDTDAELFESLTELLEVSPQGLASANHLADSYLEFLRDRRVDVIDMREVFAREGPGNFWLADQHMNLRAQALIAEELRPFVTAARPAGATRARRAPVSTGPGHPADLFSPSSAVETRAPGTEAGSGPSALLGPQGFEEARLRELFGERPHTVHDPRAGYRYEAQLAVPSTEVGFAARFPFVTNDWGFRADEDVAADVELRIVVAGDEQLVGNFENDENLCSLVEAELRERHPGRTVEVLNAAVAGHSFLNYLGVLERALELEPQVFVLAVSSGSDFMEALRVESLLAGRPFARKFAGLEASLHRAREMQPGALAHSLESIKYFREHSRMSHRTFDVAMEVTRELQRLCAEHDIELVVLQVPDAPTVEWERHEAELEPLRALLRLEPRLLDANQRLADAYMLEVERAGIRTLRVDETFRSQPQQLYSSGDLLLTPSAHRAIGFLLTLNISLLGLLD